MDKVLGEVATNDQLMLFIENAAEAMDNDALLDFVEDALGRVKSNQEANEYVQYQSGLIQALLDELRERI